MIFVLDFTNYQASKIIVNFFIKMNDSQAQAQAQPLDPVVQVFQNVTAE